MRRIVLALTLALLSVFATGGLAPAATHAQTTPLAVTVSPGTVSTGSTAMVSGSGFTPSSYAYVYYQRPDGTYNAFYLITSPTGTFSFQLGFLTSHGTGTEYVSAYDYATARWAPFAIVTVTSGTPTTNTKTLSAAPNPVARGASAVVSGKGFTPNQYVYVYWRRPDNTTNATFVFTDAAGSFSFTLGFLSAHGCGTETVQAYDYGTGTYSNPYTITVSC